MRTSPLFINAVGVISTAGTGVEALWQTCLAGRGLFQPIARFPTAGMNQTLAGTLASLTGDRHPGAQLATQALADLFTTFPRGHLPAGRCGVYLATSHNEVDIQRRLNEAELLPEAAYTDPALEAEDLVDALGAPMQRFVEASLGRPAARFTTVSAACASGLQALVEATHDLATELVDGALIVATDPFSRNAHVGFDQVRALTRDQVRPFSTERSGTLMSEAGCAFMVTRTPLGLPDEIRLLGTGASADCYSMVQPIKTGDGIVEAAGRALDAAGLAPGDLAGVYLHGTGTQQNDEAEAAAFHRLLPGRMLPACSIKGVLGHALSAAGSLSLACCTRTLRLGLLPPTHRCEPLMPGLPFRLSADAPVPVGDGPLLVLAYAFGGMNLAVVVGKGGGA